MSLETKIRELMEAKKSKAQQINEASAAAGLNAPDEAQASQGSSQKAQYTVINPHTGAAVNGEDTSLKKGGAEAQVNKATVKTLVITKLCHKMLILTHQIPALKKVTQNHNSVRATAVMQNTQLVLAQVRMAIHSNNRLLLEMA